MKSGIHPDYKVSKVTCSCGNSFETKSTIEEIRIESCSECHPFYSGKQRAGSSDGRVEKFKAKYGM